MIKENSKPYQEPFKSNYSKFELAIIELKRDFLTVREGFLKQKIKHYNDCDNVNNFILQLYDYIPFLVFFKNDLEVLTKLKEIGIKKEILIWMVDLDDVEAEIKRIYQIKGLFIFSYDFLFAICSHLDLKFKISLIDYLGLAKSYNNSNSNTFFVDSNNRLRRRSYKAMLIGKSKKNLFEQEMNKELDNLEETYNKIGCTKENLHKSLLKTLKGNTDNFLELISINLSQGISNRKVFLELFPLLKLILKDVELLGEDEFHNLKDEFYDGNYEKYKISRVKKILLK